MRRFITYLYEYDRGNRGKNCGFVRVDVREREVQMEVNMRNCLRCGEKGIIYILVKNQDEILGIEMVNIPILNGKGEHTISFVTKNIKESGYAFEQIVGIGIRCEKGGYLASNWRDEEYEALTWGNFSIVYPKEMPMPPEAKPMPIPEYVQETGNAFKIIENTRELEVENICSETDDSKKIESENKGEDGNSSCLFSELDNIRKENHSRTMCLETDNNMEEMKLEDEQENSSCAHSEMNHSKGTPLNNQRESNCCSSVFLPSNNIAQIPYNPISKNSNTASIPESCENSSTMSSQRILQNLSQIESQEESTIFQNRENQMTRNLTTLSQIQSEIDGVTFQKEEWIQSSEPENPKCNTQMQYPCRVKSPKLRKSASSYSLNTIDTPKMKRCSYKKITVSDIRNLPSPNCYLCNNNFLLHGFFNYNYLIIKTEKTENKEKCYLGVPGIFEKQEKIMAMMFGFMYFESCSPEELDLEKEFEQSEDKKQPKEGDFGCWYLSLNI